LSLILMVVVVGLALGLLPQAFARLLAVSLFAVRLPRGLRSRFEGLPACAAPPFFHGETPFGVGLDISSDATSNFGPFIEVDDSAGSIVYFRERSFHIGDSLRTKDFDPDEIADAAMRVFWQHGYAATSIQDLVDGTGLSRSSLYSTFASKQGLFQQALRRYEAVTTSNVALLSSAGTPRDLIRELLMRIAEDELTDPQRRGCLVANAALELAGQDEVAGELVAHNFQRLQKALEKLIQRGEQSGDIAARKSPHALARFFVNTMQGMRVLSKGSPPSQRRQCLLDVIDIALDVL
jgi:TetR/AcrR family transcriptional regulator, transcriptional repressor for nem operon